MELKHWQFSADGKAYESVTVPHTWNIDERFENLRAKCSYKTALCVDSVADFNILRFEAAYHDLELFINGTKCGEHIGSGYTPFEFDITDYICIGENELLVTVDNSFSENCLPWCDQFDWNCDGGLIREVYFTQHRCGDIKDVHICTESLELLSDEFANAEISVKAKLFGNNTYDNNITVKILDGDSIIEESATPIFKLIGITPWSPENPKLYTALIATENHEKAVRFGIREICTDGKRILLNQKEVVLKGVEWMPGSHPDYGMAEPYDFAIKNLEMLKDIGCNFTRFHWQQPDFIYDWCDEHGLMVQEEIPFWGPPKLPDEAQICIAKMQADEMFKAHKNHPSIVCWGVGNELCGEKAEVIEYVKEVVAYFKKLDKSRLANYVSNTMHSGADFDATMLGDVCMLNEYVGLWYTERNDVDGVIRDMLELSGNKPFMVTESGLCEPKFSGGDKRRCALYEERDKIYKNSGIAGWVYFSLNDYRTHMGEDGNGRFCQRIHGSTDLYGNKKPSFDLLKALIKS